MKNRIAILCLVIPCFLSAEKLRVDVSAPSAILINAETGAVLFEKGAHQPSYPASITKIATALYALEKKGEQLHAQAVASHDCVATVAPAIRQSPHYNHPPYRLEVGGSHIGIQVGEVLSLKTLLYGLLLSSGNDAANVIAEHVSGSVAQFVQELDEFLQSRGVNETRFLNPHGLHHPHHVTTAYDMAKITQLAFKHPQFREIVKTIRHERPKTNKQNASYLLQSNRLLKLGAYYYPKAIGVKTGYTSKAGHTLVAAASHEGRSLIAVLLGCESMEARYKDAIRLFDAAFNEKPVYRTLFSKEFDHFFRRIRGGKSSIEGALVKDLEFAFYLSEEPKIKSELKWLPVKLPVAEGDRVGSLIIKDERDNILREEPLFAVHSVNKTVFRASVDMCRDHRNGIIFGMLALNLLGLMIYFYKKTHKVIE